jgi:pimeloyl-ACP methyl ester carboxylesterase
VRPTGAYRGGAGAPMVLLHGFTDTWRAWTPIIPALEEHHDVFAPTLPGHHGGVLIEEGIPFVLATMLDRIERQMDAAGFKRAHLVGSSLGGWLALELALRGRAVSVVGVCPAGGWEPGSRQEGSVVRYFRRNAWLLKYAERSMPLVASRPRLRALGLRELMSDPSRVSATDALAMMEGAAECVIVDGALNAVRTGTIFGDLGHVDCPVRILYGTHDRILRWPAHFQKMRRILPHAEYVALEGLGHLPMWDDPALVARKILEVTAGKETLPAGNDRRRGARYP